jgi:hypothetical protein
MKKILLLLVLGTAIVIGVLAWRFVVHGQHIDITQAQIQSQLDPQFPIERNFLLLQLTLADPRVALRAGTDRIQLGMNVRVGIPSQPEQRGSAEVSGGLSYDPQTARLYLVDARIESLEVPGLSDRYRARVQEFAGVLIPEVMNRMPLYTLDQTDPRQALARRLVQSVQIVNGRVRIVLGVAPPAP